MVLIHDPRQCGKTTLDKQVGIPSLIFEVCERSNRDWQKFAGGVVIYDGGTTVRFSEGLYAVPIRA